MTAWLVKEPQKLAIDDDLRSLNVSLAQGRIRVVGADGPARIEVHKVGRRGVVVRQTEGVLEICHERASWRWGLPLWWAIIGRRAYDADISVAVPPSVSGSIAVISGSIVVSGLRDGVTTEATSGHITLMGLAGRVRAKTVSGPIQALGVAGDVSAETISGEISLADISADRLFARTISGAITADVDNPLAQDVHLDTTSGEITVRVPQDADLEVTLGATVGRVTSAFDQVRPSSAPGNHGGAGTLGTGRGRLTARAVSGSVSLLAQPAAPASEREPQ